MPVAHQHPIGSVTFEIEATPGLETVTRDEIDDLVGHAPSEQGRGYLRLHGNYRFQHLTRLRTAQSIYLVAHFPIPRPRALLGDQHFRHLIAQIERVQAESGEKFQSFHIDAAGDSTTVMQRLKQEIAARTGLRHDDEQGDLKLRILPARVGGGWEILIRITPRPSSTRWWRQHNLEGALNAAVASAMLRLANAQGQHLVVNLACGSGTLAVERALASPSQMTIALDHDDAMLAMSAAHRALIGERGRQLYLLHADMKTLPFATGSVDRLVSDLPFGQLVGTHTDNRSLYPTVLKETGRIAARGALFVLITHEVRLMDRLLERHDTWECRQQIMITLRGLHPRIYVLQRI